MTDNPNPHADVLHRLLDETQALPPEYAGGLSSHLPMALHALHALGASPARMRQFAQHYSQRFEPWPYAQEGEPLANWQSQRGQIAAYANLRASFVAAVSREGSLAVLQRSLPDLWTGVAAAAFHGLIRTAHALQTRHDAEIASGLAYWAARWQPLLAPPAAGAMPMAAWSAALAAQAGATLPPGRSIAGRMGLVQHSQTYQMLAGGLVPDNRTLAELARFAVSHYSRSGNFTVLHMVTGCRAARVLLAAVPGQQALALSALVPAFAAAFLVSGIGPDLQAQARADTGAFTDAPADAPTGAWPAVIDAALQSDDDHLIKLVHACIEEEATYGGPAYLRAAQLATMRAAT